jgi:hypothetical protein
MAYSFFGSLIRGPVDMLRFSEAREVDFGGICQVMNGPHYLIKPLAQRFAQHDAPVGSFWIYKGRRRRGSPNPGLRRLH